VSRNAVCIRKKPYYGENMMLESAFLGKVCVRKMEQVGKVGND
jgi:hypothetical protein